MGLEVVLPEGLEGAASMRAGEGLARVLLLVGLWRNTQSFVIVFGVNNIGRLPNYDDYPQLFGRVWINFLLLNVIIVFEVNNLERLPNYGFYW